MKIKPFKKSKDSKKKRASVKPERDLTYIDPQGKEHDANSLPQFQEHADHFIKRGQQEKGG